ncbi:MAG: ABC transporter ATP-binding protein [Candidatus Kerfeldbacteria bacterium]|nr:ABC transporter ATP-binding protein [Candidatus Kerfeldbacteria bacterium]
MNEGEILGLLGPNGAGKSTTISLLLGVLTPTSGVITVFGKNFFTHRSDILQSMTFASTYVRMPWRLTVLENLRVYALLYKVPKKIFMERAEELLTLFGVWEQRNKTIGGLSAGQITRLMLAKAFIPRPRIVLLDEPTASLDPDISHEVRRFVLDQQKKYGLSILYTSHNMDEVTEVCNRVVFLQHGNIIAIDTPQKLARSISIDRVRLVVATPTELKHLRAYCAQKKYRFRLKGRTVTIDIHEDHIPALLREIHAVGMLYTQIEIDKPDLEEYFLHMAKKKKQ